MELKSLLERIGQEGKRLADEEFIPLLNQAKGSNEEFIRETAGKVEQWLGMISRGELRRDEFDELVETRKRSIRLWLNTLDVHARVHAEHFTVDLVSIAQRQVAALISNQF